MRIVEIRDEIVSIRSSISNAFISFAEMTVSAVAIITDVERSGKRVIGYGFHSNGRYAQRDILRRRLVPRLLAAAPEQLLTERGDNFDPFKAWDVMMKNEKPGGHGERSVAVGAIDMALWDLVGKLEEKPLYQVLAERGGDRAADEHVSIYAAGGYYYPGKELEGLRQELEGYREQGYTEFKIKIGGVPLEQDIERIEAALEIAGSGSALAVDANGRFDRDTALAYGEALAPFGLKWYEEPGDPLDYDLLAQVAAATKTPLATGENLFSHQDTRNLIRYGGLDPERDILQMDPTLSYGLVEYLRTVDVLRESGWSLSRCVPHGGHQLALHVAAGIGLGGSESYPGVFEPFGGFADDLPIVDGTVRVPDAPGVGIELKGDLMDIFSQLAGTWAIAALALICLVFGAQPTPAAEPSTRNVVLVVSDDQGQDAGCYGNPAIKTPNMDRLAADGTLFTHAFCTTASCSASRSVILTGLYNHRTAQYGHEHTYHHFRTYGDIKSLPVLLTEAGYRTARIGKYHVGPEDVYRFDVALPGSARNPVEMARNCRGFLSAKDARPFFLYFCTADPHRSGGFFKDAPHAPNRFGNKPRGETYPGVERQTYRPQDVVVPPYLPDTPVCRAELAQYYESVSRVDQGLGLLMELLKQTGHWENTLFIYISDHGIAFPGAKTTCYEPGLRSPCIIRHPGVKQRGITSRAMISWVDLTPTILDYAGGRPQTEPPLQGRSFLGVIGMENPAGWDEVYASHTFHEITMYYPMRVVRERRYKLIWNIAYGLTYPSASDLWESPTWLDIYAKGPKAIYGKRTVEAYRHRPEWELYDLEQDPHEIHNLAEDREHTDVLARLKTKLRAFQEETRDPWRRKWRYE